MTTVDAREYIPNLTIFRKEACEACKQSDYCPQYCDTLLKAERMDFNRILKCYARHDGEMYKVLRWLKQARI